MGKRRTRKETKAFHKLIQSRYAARRALKEVTPKKTSKPVPKKSDKRRRLVILRKPKILNERGYPLTKDGKLEHREIYKEVYGSIPKDWIIHHIDQCKTNNLPENLVALPQDLHHELHKAMWQSATKWNTARQFKFLRKRFKEMGIDGPLKVMEGFDKSSKPSSN